MLSIAVIEPEYEINLGYIARVMKNFGLEELLLINPKCDISKARIYATHGSDILDNAKVVSKDYLKNYDQLIGTTAIKASSRMNIIRDAISPEDAVISKNACLILGRESTGLTNDELALCDLIITINAGKYNTLNISHALAIILYELTKKKDANVNSASREEIELLLNYVLMLAKKAGIKEHKHKHIEHSLKRLLGRALPTSREVKLLVILLRKAILAIERKKQDLGS
ncbi:MAG: RNA methyltransferase [Candidatus Nitrosocaldaceae archaeon]|nr:MAG: RNA methyltransferase [Candidatus Nitrosocaldaceae archaeon]